MDDRYWYPFTYVENSVAMGMHVDIVKKALTNLGYQINIKPIPRKRAVKYAGRGTIDGIISISYNSDISKSLEFPSDAYSKSESKWRIMQVDHMIITFGTSNYEYEGKLNSLPPPVRVPLGETFTNRLRKTGIRIEETKTDLQNFRMLMRDKKGSVITASVIAESMYVDPEFKGKFTIQHIPLASQSYHLAFAPKVDLTSSEKKKIWEEIARLRDDYVFMLQVFAHY